MTLTIGSAISRFGAGACVVFRQLRERLAHPLSSDQKVLRYYLLIGGAGLRELQ
jgi:hypothetical protein